MVRMSKASGSGRSGSGRSRRSSGAAGSRSMLQNNSHPLRWSSQDDYEWWNSNVASQDQVVAELAAIDLAHTKKHHQVGDRASLNQVNHVNQNHAGTSASFQRRAQTQTREPHVLTGNHELMTVIASALTPSEAGRLSTANVSSNKSISNAVLNRQFAATQIADRFDNMFVTYAPSAPDIIYFHLDATGTGIVLKCDFRAHSVTKMEPVDREGDVTQYLTEMSMRRLQHRLKQLQEIVATREVRGRQMLLRELQNEESSMRIMREMMNGMDRHGWHSSHKNEPYNGARPPAPPAVQGPINDTLHAELNAMIHAFTAILAFRRIVLAQQARASRVTRLGG